MRLKRVKSANYNVFQEHVKPTLARLFATQAGLLKTVMSRFDVDAKGLKCPMPVIKLQKQVRACQSGDDVVIDCTDAGAEKDIGSWARVNRHEVLSCEPTDFGWRITLRVGGRNPL